MEQKNVQELAEKLKSKGLAASMVDAIDKAKNIIFGLTTKKEEPKVQEQKEESKEVINTNIDESKVIDKDVFEDIKEVENDTSSIEIKNDKDQQKLDKVDIESDDYDISKEERTVNEVLDEKKEDVFTSSHESDNLLKKEQKVSIIEETAETITSMDESNSEETPIKIEDIPKTKEYSEESPISIEDIPEEKMPEQPSQKESSEEKTQLTEEAKKKTDLSDIFDFSKR